MLRHHNASRGVGGKSVPTNQTSMAFHTHNPNSLGPVVYPIETWGVATEKKKSRKSKARLGDRIHCNSSSNPINVFAGVHNIEPLIHSNHTNHEEGGSGYFVSPKTSTLGNAPTKAFSRVIERPKPGTVLSPLALPSIASSTAMTEALTVSSANLSTVNQPPKSIEIVTNTPLDYWAAARTHLNLCKTADTTKTAFHLHSDNGVNKMQQLQQQKTPPSNLVGMHEKYGKMIHSLSLEKNRAAARQAGLIIHDMISHGISPDGSNYHCVIRALAQSGLPHKAEAMLYLMHKDWKKNGNPKAVPQLHCFTMVLNAWRKGNLPESPERSEALFEYMYELAITQDLPGCKPDNVSVGTLLNCWLDSSRNDAIDKVEALFRTAKVRFLSGEMCMRPDEINYSILMNAYKIDNNFQSAEDLLWEMVDDYHDGNVSCEPSSRHFNTILSMYAKATVADKVERAEQLVTRFRELGKSGLLAGAKPDEYTYSLLLKCGVTSSRPDGINRAVTTLGRMRQFYAAGDEAARPDVVKYVTIITAYSDKGDCGNAEKILGTMIDDFMGGNELAKPSLHHFEMVIRACVNKGEPCRAESVLRLVWKINDSRAIHSFHPTLDMYKAIIFSYCKHYKPNKAETLLWAMQSKQAVGPKITKGLIQAVINAWHEESPQLSRSAHKRVNALRAAKQKFHVVEGTRRIKYK